MTATAGADPPAFRHNHRGRFEVLVHHRGHCDGRGTYRDRDDAQRVAARLCRHRFAVPVDHDQGW